MHKLQQFRANINEIDNEILILLAKRFVITEKVGVFKAENQISPVDKIREEEIFNNLRQKAEEHGLSPEMVVKIWRLIIDESVERHKRLRINS